MLQIISSCVVYVDFFLNCRYFSSLQMQMSLSLNLRAVLVRAETEPSVCPQGPGSPAASTPQLCAWQMQKVSTKAMFITTYYCTIISLKLLVAIIVRIGHLPFLAHFIHIFICYICQMDWV